MLLILSVCFVLNIFHNLCQQETCKTPRLFIATGSEDSTVKILDIMDGGRCEIHFNGHKDAVYTFKMSKGGDLLFSGSKDQSILVWDVKTGTLKYTPLLVEYPIFNIDLSPDDKILASALANGEVKLWDSANRTLLTKYSTEINNTDIKFSPDNNFLAVGGFYDLSMHRGAIKILNLKKKIVEFEIIASSENSSIIILSFLKTQENSFLLSGCQNGSILVHDAGNNYAFYRTLTKHTNAILSLAISEDGSLVASVSSDFKIIIWHSSNFTEKNTLSGHNIPITSVDFSPDAKFLVTGYSDGTVNVWDLARSTCIRNGSFHSSAIWMIKFFKCPGCQDTLNPTCTECYLNPTDQANHELGLLKGSSYIKCKDYGCKNCTINGGNIECVNCLQGYQFDKGTCLCGKDCISCDQNNYCLKCLNNLYLKPYSQDCTLCLGELEDVDMYKLFAEKTNYCLNKSLCLLPYCKTCTNFYKNCLVCQSNYYLDLDPAASASQCSECNVAGYFRSGIYCKKCKSECQTCENEISCTTCPEGLYLLRNDSGYSSNCSKCQGEGLFKKEKFCEKCRSDCITCVSSEKCTSCPPGHYLQNIADGNTVCSKCENEKCSNEEKDKNRMPLILGLSIGISAGVIFVILVVIYFFKKGKKHKSLTGNHSTSTNTDNPTQTKPNVSVFIPQNHIEDKEHLKKSENLKIGNENGTTRSPRKPHL